jgi:hypothetical protein
MDNSPEVSPEGEALEQGKQEGMMNMPRPADTYSYPAVPGTDEWAAFKTGEEMMEACQIPVDMLKNMSTHGIIQSILEHPLLSGIVHRFQYRTDFDSFVSGNHAYEELKARKDAGTCLLERLTLVDPVIPDAEFDEPHVLEIILSQAVFLSRLNDSEKRTVVKTAFKNDDLRQKAYPENSLRRTYWRAVTWLLAGRTMANAGYAPFVEEMERNIALQIFLDGSNHYTYMQTVDEPVPQMIIHHAVKYTNK